MIRVALAAALLTAVAAGPVSAQVPAADRPGDVALAGSTVLWDGDGALEGQGLVVAAARLPDGTYATGRVVSTPGRVARVAGATADGTGRAVFVLIEDPAGLPGSVPRLVEIAPDGALRGRDLARPRRGVLVGSADVAVNPRGDAVVVWERWASGPRSSALMLARRTAAGAWSAPVMLAGHAADAPGLAPRVAIDAAGRFVVAWRRDGVFALTGTAAGGTSAPRRIDAGPAVDVAVAAAGERAVITWARSVPGGDRAYVALRRAGGRIGAPRALAPRLPGRFVTRVTAAAGPEGTLVAGYALERRAGAARAVAYRAAFAASGGRFGAVAVVTPFHRPPAGSSPFAAVVGADGTAALIWRREGRVELAFATPGDGVARPVVLGTSAANGGAGITALERGALVAWTGRDRVRITAVDAPG